VASSQPESYALALDWLIRMTMSLRCGLPCCFHGRKHAVPYAI